MVIVLPWPAGVCLRSRLSSNVRRHQRHLLILQFIESMHYDLAAIEKLCIELELEHELTGNSVAVKLDSKATLRFKNYRSEEDGTDDCLVGFDSTPSHSHGDLEFYAREMSLDMNYLQALTAAVDGVVLICERWENEELVDRWLVHKDYIDEFNYLGPNEEIRIRRARPR